MSDLIPPTGIRTENDNKRSEATPEPTFVQFLMTPEAVKGVENLIVNIMEKTRSGHALQHVFLSISLIVIISAIVGLSVYDKLNPSAGVILGSLAGYLFGRRED